MKPAVVWTIGVVLVAAAWGVQQLAPASDASVAPFAVSATVGEPAVGRAFEITVTDVRLGDRAVARGWSADGTWLVVDLEAEARLQETGSSLAHAELVVDGITYRASERPDSLLQAVLATGIPRAGSLAFELPDAAALGRGVLILGLDDDTRLDSVVEVAIDLGSVPREGEVELLRDGWAER
jgi:hypothetical protein